MLIPWDEVRSKGQCSIEVLSPTAFVNGAFRLSGFYSALSWSSRAILSEKLFFLYGAAEETVGIGNDEKRRVLDPRFSLEHGYRKVEITTAEFNDKRAKEGELPPNSARYYDFGVNYRA